MTFTLPPEAQDREVTVLIPKEVDPYFKQWYLETKKDGESPSEFAYRNLAKAGLSWRRNKLKLDAMTGIQATDEEENIEMQTIILDNGLE